MFCLTFVCVLLGASPVPAVGDTLTVGVVQSPKNLDSQASSDAQSHNTASQFTEMLVRATPDGKVRPWLAERWEIAPDKMSTKFFLKKGVKFHNGEIMTADDVVYTFERALGPGGGAIRSLTAHIAGVEKVDDHTVILKSKQPMGDVFVLSLTHPWAGIMNKKAVDKFGKDYGQNPVGTGKFKFKRWLIGDRVELERFEDYHGEPAKFNHLIFRTIVEAASRTIELESGAVDFIQDVAPVDMSRVKGNPKLVATAVPSNRLWHIAMDLNMEPFNNPKVRQAMSMAIKREAICKVAFRGFARPARGMTTSACKYALYDATPPFKEDTAAARKLLAEAGFPNGFKMKLMISDRTDHTSISTILQANLKEIGIDVEIQVYEWGAFLQASTKPGHWPYLNNWWGAAPALDPFFLLQPPFHSAGIPVTNRAFYVNKELDAMFMKGAAMADGPERAKLYGEIWDLLNRELPWVPLIEQQTVYGQTKELKGIDHGPGIVNYFADAYFVAPKK